MQSQYQYVRVKNQGKNALYCALQRHPLSLAWSLYWHGEPFGFRRRGLRNTIRCWKDLAGLLLQLFYYRLFAPRSCKNIELPVSGHVCLKVHNGYKVFDLRRKVTIKVFSPEIDRRVVRHEIDRVRSLGEYAFAPTVRRWNVEECWYEEEYVNSNPVTQESLIPLLARMILAVPAEKVSIKKYLQRQRDIVHGEQSKLSNESLDIEAVDKIRSFIDAMIHRLHAEGDRSIFLVFSHGDFTRRHVFTADSGQVIVDWETLGHRSAMFDLHDSFFQRFVNGHPVPHMAVEVEAARSQLRSRLALRMTPDNESLIESLDAIDVYRLLYYIESIVSYVEQCKEMTEKGLKKLLLMSDAYYRYEEDLDVFNSDSQSPNNDFSRAGTSARIPVTHDREHGTQSHYRYVRVSNFGTREQFLSLEQNPFLLAWLLYWYGKPLSYRAQGLRSTLGGFKRLLFVTCLLLYRRFFSPKAKDVLELPVTGQLCLRVRNGYKVFDFRRKIVAKIFTPDIDLAKVSRQIEWAERLGVHHFAPTVRDWNIEERWYEEEYINGYQAAASNWTKLVSLLADTILAFPPQEVRTLDHVLERRELIRRSKLFNERHDQSKLAAMQRFVDTTIDHLRRSGDKPIFLVCSHGDFSPSHVLSTKHKDVVIDWEAAANRSALFDLHNSFFRRLRGGATATGMAEAIEQAISQLKGFLVQRGRGAHDVLTESLATAEIYRRVYYVEYIYSYVEKENVKARHLDRILFFMDAFNHHEERLLAATKTMER